jgi:ubiquinol-cytochrome c reductase iron-sulfur subunit
MPIATLSDPHMGDAAKNPDRVEKLIAVIFVLAIVCVALFGAAYWQNWNPWILGGAIGAGLFLLGFGLTAWGKYLMPQGPFVEERHPLASTQAERDSMSAALVERTTVVVKRRKMLGGLFAVGAGIFGIVAAFPLLRSLGPVPKTSFDVTGWRRGMRLVDSTGRPVSRGTLVVGGIMTVYPRDTVLVNAGPQPYITDEGQSVDQTVLIRLSDQDVTTMPAVRAGRPPATWPIRRPARISGARSACTSRSSNYSSAPATSPCSTSATGPCPNSAPPPGRCPSWR